MFGILHEEITGILRNAFTDVHTRAPTHAPTHMHPHTHTHTHTHNHIHTRDSQLQAQMSGGQFSTINKLKVDVSSRQLFSLVIFFGNFINSLKLLPAKSNVNSICLTCLYTTVKYRNTNYLFQPAPLPIPLLLLCRVSFPVKTSLVHTMSSYSYYIYHKDTMIMQQVLILIIFDTEYLKCNRTAGVNECEDRVFLIVCPGPALQPLPALSACCYFSTHWGGSSVLD